MAKRRRGEPPSGTPRKAAAGRTAGEFRAQGTVKTALFRGNTFAREGCAVRRNRWPGDLRGRHRARHRRRSRQDVRTQLRAEMASGVASGIGDHRARSSDGRTAGCPSPSIPALPNQARVTDAIAHWEAHTSFRFVARTTERGLRHLPAGQRLLVVGRPARRPAVRQPRARLHHRQHDPRDRPRRSASGTSRAARTATRSSRSTGPRSSPGMEHNFNQHITDGDDVGAYDFGSIMHYPRNAFSIDGTDTITPIVAVPPGSASASAPALSAGDIAAANSLCPAKLVKEGPKDHDQGECARKS